MGRRKRMIRYGLRQTAELPLENEKNRLCSRAAGTKSYLDIRTMDWCKPCIWESVRT